MYDPDARKVYIRGSGEIMEVDPVKNEYTGVVKDSVSYSSLYYEPVGRLLYGVRSSEAVVDSWASRNNSRTDSARTSHTLTGAPTGSTYAGMSLSASTEFGKTYCYTIARATENYLVCHEFRPTGPSGECTVTKLSDLVCSGIASVAMGSKSKYLIGYCDGFKCSNEELPHLFRATLGSSAPEIKEIIIPYSYRPKDNDCAFSRDGSTAFMIVENSTGYAFLSIDIENATSSLMKTKTKYPGMSACFRFIADPANSTYAAFAVASLTSFNLGRRAEGAYCNFSKKIVNAKEMESISDYFYLYP
ncbi:hypothetical protein [Nocardia terpenica]|nr:hypothetical protein [Nocardia terpenica]